MSKPSTLPSPKAKSYPPSAGFAGTWIYRQLLKGPAPKGPRWPGATRWPGDPGDPERGKAILSGEFAHAGESYHIASPQDLPASASLEWLNWYHGQSWLRHLKALNGQGGGAKAPYVAREHLFAWMETYGRSWTYPAWQPQVAAERLIQWMQCWDFLLFETAAGPFQKALRQTIGRHARHVLKSKPPGGKSTVHGYSYFHTVKGQMFAALGLFKGERCQNVVLSRLEHEISSQIWPDGGHVERNPERLMSVLEDLLDLRALTAVTLGHVPGFLQNAIDRTAPMLRAMRHPDGGLAIFNGGLEGNPDTIAHVLAQTDPTSPPLSAPYVGFQKLQAGRSTIIMDCGKPGGPGEHHHAGSLSFEMSVDQQRMIVNCGARPGRPIAGEMDWHTALAATAAHSTLTVNDTSSAAFDADRTLRRGPVSVTCDRSDQTEGSLVEASHDGYANTFGLTHKRALFLSPGGDDIRGEDRLLGSGGAYFTLRFHLHPNVKVSLLGEGNGALLRLGNKNKASWRLRASQGTMSLEDSVYMGRAGESRRTEQIIISGPLSGNGALIKWALSQQG